MSYDIPAKHAVLELDFTITAGMRVGLVGPNGSGKTTLLRLLRGEIAPSDGEIRRADFLKIVYFDQTRTLDPELTLRRALAPDSDAVVYQDRVVHVASWAARFLFTGEQLNQPVGQLSGGERARVLIAQLMLQPADVLLLDEPTNDLDIPTLEILEESLLEFRGALVLVTHDRYLLDRVSTVVLGLDGLGQAEPFADYSQWAQWQSQQKQTSKSAEREERVETTARTSGEEEVVVQGSPRVRDHRATDRRGRSYAAGEISGGGGSGNCFGRGSSDEGACRFGSRAEGGRRAVLRAGRSWKRRQKN